MSGSTAEPLVIPQRRRRRWPWVLLVVLLVVIGLLAIAAVIGDRVFRSNAERQIEQSVEASLPAGVTGNVDASIVGGSALQQYLAGSFDEVDLRSEGLKVAGAPASATVKLTGLPVNGGEVSLVSADLSVAQSAFKGIPQLRRLNASDPVLGKGTVSTTLTQTILGFAVKVKVVTTPTLDTSTQIVRLKPASATLTAGPASVPATVIVQQLLPDGVAVCAARYLPRGVKLTSVTAVPGAAKVHITAEDINIATLSTASTGTCS